MRLIMVKVVCLVFIVAIVLLYGHMQYHNDTIIKMQEDFFRKISTSHFICNVWKGCVGFHCERELETEQKLQYFDPHSYGRQRCVFLVLQMLNQRPRGSLCWVRAFSNASYQQLLWTPTHQGPKAPSAWCGFPYHISSITPPPTVTGTTVWLLSWLSYIIV